LGVQQYVMLHNYCFLTLAFLAQQQRQQRADKQERRDEGKTGSKHVFSLKKNRRPSNSNEVRLSILLNVGLCVVGWSMQLGATSWLMPTGRCIYFD
jgi:hypothetical protein